ncbi:hypothetical protein GCM10023339_08630 [Alloalcanivorax gelatiniphagus]
MRRLRFGNGEDMILSGYLSHDRADRAATSARLSSRIAEIEARRRAAERSVGQLADAWRGDAGRHEESGWQEWDDAARHAIDALSALLGTLDLAREEAAQAAEARTTVTVPHQTRRRPDPEASRLPDLHRSGIEGLRSRSGS